MLIIGLTGGIATGKSTAGRVFEARGVPVVDADAIAHKVLEPGGVSYRLVVQHFGAAILQAGSLAIDRAKLGGIIFNDSEKRQLLNRCTHPYVRRRILGEVLKCYVRGHAVCVVDVPLLFESGLDAICGKTAVVACSDEQQIARLLARSNGALTRQEAEARIASQMPLKDKMRRASRVLDNSGAVADLERQIHALLDDWTPSLLRTLAALLAPVGIVVSLPFARSSAYGLGALCACTAWALGSLVGV
ncbi:Dephospho-CoA kinase [Coemansia javaensis]|uniref:Dephospho-CoA kinase n=1 Tax=Coemansia javaensis TaxID=2761396 RepID=A0A9W8LKJ3_9FUNG|nr:Dephospho-CoA kinase [Coemansia javaensis]